MGGPTEKWLLTRAVAVAFQWYVFDEIDSYGDPRNVADDMGRLSCIQWSLEM